MPKSLLPLLVFVGLALPLLAADGAAERGAAKAGALQWQPYTVEIPGVGKEAAELGMLQVPENRQRPDSRLIELSFVRLKSLSPHPAPPVVYLAGGPGGSGIDALGGPRQPLFAALRQVADVIAIDQRGVGRSAPFMMLCRESWFYPVDRPVSRDEMIAVARQHSQSCAALLARSHIDTTGYTSDESADDLEDLRRALGVPQLSLWGVSYGSSLALTAIRRHP